MKIIGKSSGGFIIEAAEKEVYNLIGFYYSGDTGAPRLDVGSTVNVSEMYMQLYDLKRNKGSLAKFAKELHAAADLLTVKDPIINNIAEKVK